ncbi:MAG: ABC transporter permease [Kiritimatiellia bacterium]|nr:ABC transporter permease [Kiritimatiellia bacterium]
MRAALVVARIVWLETIRRKEVYVLAILLGVMVAAVSLLDAFGLGGSTRHILDLGLLLAWLFSVILTLAVAGRQLPREEERGTIFVLLSKPLSRMEWLVGKMLGGWGGVFAATAVFYLLIVGLALLQGGSPDGEVALQALLLHGAALGVLTALGLALSIRVTADAAWTLTAVITAFLFFVIPEVPRLVLTADPVAGQALSVLYYSLPNLDLFDLRQRLVHDWGPVSWRVIAGVVAYAAAWMMALLALAWMAFRHRRFNRKSA